MSLTAGTRLGRYEIRSKLGAGGMGEVYLAHDTKLDRKVAIKFLNQEFSKDQDKLNRFVREARAASALNHPNILTVHEIGEVDGRNYIVTELIDGTTLRQRLAHREPLSLNAILKIGVQVAEALAAAHAAGIIHRDIKPENIMIRRDGYAKVLDFGLAKLSKPPGLTGGLIGSQESSDAETSTRVLIKTTPGLVMGTVRYMSPEQVRGKEVDACTDIFSLGVVMYEMLAGRLPFRGETNSDVIAAILTSEPAPPSSLNEKIPTDFDRIVHNTLAKERDERYQTAADLLADLRQLQRRLELEVEAQREFVVTRPISKSEQSAIRTADATRGSAADPRNSVAVLPFNNSSADPENEYFCDGLAEELLNALAKINELRVVARTSAFSFKGKNVSVSEIGKALNVNSVLEGSVRKSGNRLRITAQLVNVDDGYQLWSERYDRMLEDVFDIQDEISLAIIDALKLRLLGETKESVLKRYTADPKAYEFYLKARFHFSKFTEAGFNQAIEYFNRAIAISPEYALAYAGLAECYAIAASSNLAPQEAFPKAQVAAKKALYIDDQLTEVHTSLAVMNMYYLWDWDKAEEEFNRALDLNPGNTSAHQWYARFLALMGRFQEAFAHFERVRELNPLDVNLYLAFGDCFYRNRQYDKAIEQYLNARELDNSPRARSYLLYAYLHAERFNEAIRELEGPLNDIALGYAYAVLGRTNEALKILERLKELSEQRYFAPYHFAIIYAGLGETDLAFEYLERAYEERSVWLTWLKFEPKFDSIRSDSRFADLLRRVGLPL